MRNEKSPNFFSEFSTRILLRKMPECFEDFSGFVSWEAEIRKKNHKKNPRHSNPSNAKSPGKFKRKDAQKSSGERAEVAISELYEELQESCNYCN